MPISGSHPPCRWGGVQESPCSGCSPASFKQRVEALSDHNLPNTAEPLVSLAVVGATSREPLESLGKDANPLV